MTPSVEVKYHQLHQAFKGRLMLRFQMINKWIYTSFNDNFTITLKLEM
jgi:hypothetical protein